MNNATHTPCPPPRITRTSRLCVETRCAGCCRFEPVSETTVGELYADDEVAERIEETRIRCAKSGQPTCPHKDPLAPREDLAKNKYGLYEFEKFALSPTDVTRINGVDLLSLQATLHKIRSAKSGIESLDKDVAHLQARVIAGFSLCAIAIVVLAVVLGCLA